MPRPKPDPENATIKGPHSLPAKVKIAAQRVVNPDKPGIEDYSSLLKVALVEYLERHHQGLIDKVAAELRAAYSEHGPHTDLKAAEHGAAKPVGAAARANDEGPGAYGPDVHTLAAGEAARRKRKGVVYPSMPRRGGGTKGRTKSKTGR